MTFTAKDVQALREATGAGMMDCKKALTENGGNFDKSVDWLREKGIAKAAKREGRVAAEGAIFSYIHLGGKIGVQVEFSGVAPGLEAKDEFQTLVKEIGMQIAASSPQYISRAAVPADLLDKERAIYRAQMENSGKPANVIEKIVDGKLGSFYAQVVLPDQASIRDPKTTVADVLAAASKALGATVTVTRFARLKVGETV